LEWAAEVAEVAPYAYFGDGLLERGRDVRDPSADKMSALQKAGCQCSMGDEHARSGKKAALPAARRRFFGLPP